MSLTGARLGPLGRWLPVPLTRRFSLCACIRVSVGDGLSPVKGDLVVTWWCHPPYQPFTSASYETTSVVFSSLIVKRTRRPQPRWLVGTTCRRCLKGHGGTASATGGGGGPTGVRGAKLEVNLDLRRLPVDNHDRCLLPPRR